MCQVCGETYGPLDTSRHTNLVHFPAKPATKSADGHVEYWFCDGCGKVVDIWCGDLTEMIESRTGCRIAAYTLDLHGLCPVCSAAEANRAK